MKSVLFGLIAALLACSLFAGGLILWQEMTGQGSGVSTAQTESEHDAELTALMEERVGQRTAELGLNNASSRTADDTASADASGADAGTAASGTQEDGSAAAASSGATSNASADLERRIYRTYIAALKDDLHTALPAARIDVTQDEETDKIIISITESGLIERLSAAQIDNSTMTIWNEEKADMQRICKGCYDDLVRAGISDGHVVLNLLNERDIDQIILSYEDGIMVHDGLPDTHTIVE